MVISALQKAQRGMRIICLNGNEGSPTRSVDWSNCYTDVCGDIIKITISYFICTK